MNLEGVQDPQDTWVAQTKIREDPQGVVEAPLRHKDNKVLLGHVLNFKDRDLWLLRAGMCCSKEHGEPATYRESFVIVW